MVTIKNLSKSVKQHSLHSLNVNKCLHVFCKRSNIDLETLLPNWEILKPIKFSPSAKNIELDNGPHQVHYVKLLKQSYIERIMSLKTIDVKWDSKPKLNGKCLHHAQNNAADVQALSKECEALRFWGVKLYDLSKIWLGYFRINSDYFFYFFRHAE